MRDLTDFSAAVLKLAGVAPDRMTVAQSVFFLSAGLADLRGRPVTFSEIREEVGEAISKSLHTTYKTLTDESVKRDGKRQPGLGWLRREIDPDDNRRKYLRLTSKGRAILNEIGMSFR